MSDPQWKIKKHVKRVPKLKSPILIEGLPGIGNVGKITVDFLIDELQAKPLYSMYAYTFPNSVFINEENLVDLPKIAVYYAKLKGKDHDLILIAGDLQPNDEVSCYSFSELMLDMLQEFGGNEIITIGGIGIMDEPDEQKIHTTGNSKEIIKRYKRYGKLNNKIYGVVGPIIGVTGLLVGLAEEYEMQAIALLAETFGHPMALGIKVARSILRIIDKRVGLNINIKQLDKEIARLEKEMKQRKGDLMHAMQQSGVMQQESSEDDVKYIG